MLLIEFNQEYLIEFLNVWNTYEREFTSLLFGRRCKR
jgi:hypothetical protein